MKPLVNTVEKYFTYQSNEKHYISFGDEILTYFMNKLTLKICFNRILAWFNVLMIALYSGHLVLIAFKIGYLKSFLRGCYMVFI